MPEEKIKATIKANPRCKYCLGSGMSTGLFMGSDHVCPCVTEQLKIIIVDKDMSIQDRYTPGVPVFEKEGG